MRQGGQFFFLLQIHFARSPGNLTVMCNKRYSLVHHKRLLLPARGNQPNPRGLLQPPPLQCPVPPRAEQLSAHKPHENYFFPPKKLLLCFRPAQTTLPSLPLSLCIFMAFPPFLAACALLLPTHTPKVATPSGSRHLTAVLHRANHVIPPATPPPRHPPSRGSHPPAPVTAAALLCQGAAHLP